MEITPVGSAVMEYLSAVLPRLPLLRERARQRSFVQIRLATNPSPDLRFAQATTVDSPAFVCRVRIVCFAVFHGLNRLESPALVHSIGFN